MLIVLDGRIGCTEYRSVHGTLDAFQRFFRHWNRHCPMPTSPADLGVATIYPRSLRQLEGMAPELFRRLYSQVGTSI
jgi:hypothetical protein